MEDELCTTDPQAALAEAERRIEEFGYWWTVRGPRLSALDRLPRNLASVTSSHIDISGTRISDLSGLSARSDLESLTLNDLVTDISGVEQLGSLETLVAYNAPIRDLSPLARCPSLRILKLNVAQAADLSPLAALPSLEQLALWSYRGQQLWAGAPVRQLQIIHASPRCADLTPLENWPCLESLSCDGGAIAGRLPVLPTVDFLGVPGCNDDQFRSLSGYSRLKSLFAYDGELTDLGPLSHCAALETVSLSRTQVSDLSPLARCMALERIDLAGTGVSDVTPLLDKPLLRSIDITGTQVSEISGLSWLPRLERLTADRTPVSDLSGWNPASAIRWLSLAETRVTSGSPLQGSQLGYLDLSGTGLSDLGFIRTLPRLHGLKVRGTNASDIAPIVEHPHLLYDVTRLDYRDRLGYVLDFADTPLTRQDPELHAISLLDGNSEAGLRQTALRERYRVEMN